MPLWSDPTDFQRRHLVYDAWNRLVAFEIYEPGEFEPVYYDRARYTYYGLHQRATSFLDTDFDAQYTLDEKNHFYYDAAWRLLERRIDEDASGSFAMDDVHQYVWSNGYIDELCFYQTTPELTGEEDGFEDADARGFFAMCDRNYSVIAIAEVDATYGNASIERVRYEAYGRPFLEPVGDIDGDGTTSTITDGNFFLYHENSGGSSLADTGDDYYGVEPDTVRDGDVDLSTDSASLYSGLSGGRDALWASGSIVGFTGLLYEEVTGLYLARHRWHEPVAGRLITRDPAGYESGNSLYEWVGSAAVSWTDPFGLHPYPGHSPSDGPFFRPTIREPEPLAPGPVRDYFHGHPNFTPKERELWDDLGFAEKLCARNAFEKARDVAREFPREDRFIPPANSLVHCVWSCELSKCLGTDRAKEWTDGHETTSPRSDPDTARDLHNNDKGRDAWRDIYRDAYDEWRRGLPNHSPLGSCNLGCPEDYMNDDDCECKCKEALDNGDLAL